MNFISSNGVIVHFHVRVSTTFGQEVFVSGNIPELGNWDSEKSIKMHFEQNLDYWTVDVELQKSKDPRIVEYKYIISNGDNKQWEPEQNHKLVLGEINENCIINIEDHFHWRDNVLDAFSRATFVGAINSRESPVKSEPITVKQTGDAIQTYFATNCPYVRPNQVLRIVGNVPELGNWDPKNSLVLADGCFPAWTGNKVFAKSSFPFEYKYVIENKDNSTFIWEECENRVCPVPVLSDGKVINYIQDWFVSPNKDLFKGMGIYVPLFSLRTNDSQGIGSYTDLKKCVDACNKMGASLIQLLPINDTTEKGEWCDSYPYRQVSCFALHPVYIDLLAITDKIPAAMKKEIVEAKERFEKFEQVEYPEVFAFKMKYLKEIFKLEKDNFVKDGLEQFLKKNGSWLKPYALFCLLRDEYKTTEFRSGQSIQQSHQPSSNKSASRKRMICSKSTGFSTSQTSSSKSHTTMQQRTTLHSRVTSQSVSTSIQSSAGHFHSSSDSTCALVLLLMTSHLMDRTGDSQHTTGKRWRKMDSHGGAQGSQEWQNSTISSELTTSSDSSEFGRSHAKHA